MNSDKVEGKAKEAMGKTKEVAGKATGDTSTEYKGKAEKNVGKAGAVKGDVKEDLQQDESRARAGKHGSDDGSVLSELNGNSNKR